MQRLLNIASSDIREVETYLSDIHAPVSLKALPGKTTYGLVGKTACFCGLALVWLRTIGNYEIYPRGRDDCVDFHFVSLGSTEYRSEQGRFHVHEGSAIACRHPLSIRTSHNCVYATITVSRSALQNRLSVLLDRPAIKCVEFAQGAIDRRDVVPALSKLVQEFQHSSLLSVVNAIGNRSTSIADALVDSILMSYPSNFSETLKGSTSTVAPRHVKRALDYINAHPKRHITPQKLADHSSVSIRSLQYSFRATTGYTVSEYQRNLRLRGAIEDLIARPDVAIHVIVSEWGFTSPSMFSQLCRKAYGMTPSELRLRKGDPL